MWTKVLPEYLMGRIDDSIPSYHRLDLKSADDKYTARLKYDCGVFFCFSCKTKSIRLKTKIHYNGSFRKIAAEFEVLGKLNGSWELLNKVTPKTKAASDRCAVLYFDLFGNEYDEFQVCFPAQGRVEDYLWIETDSTPIFKKLPLKAILLGSSVSQTNNASSHGSICCAAYRLFNVNIASVGISVYHSLLCPELMEKLKSYYKKVNIVVMDVYHINNDILNAFKKLFKDNVYYPVINSICRKDVIDICKNDKDLDIIHIDGNGRYDEVHLNDYGVIKYLEELNNRGII